MLTVGLCSLKVHILYSLKICSFTVSLAQGRSRREKKDKHGRFAALAKLKEAKARGEKHKYDVSLLTLILLFTKTLPLQTVAPDQMASEETL